MDIADLAQIQEMNTLEDALTAHRLRRVCPAPDEEPLYLDRVRCCLDCEEPIPERRLETNPNAVRCVPCQERKDRRP